MKGYTIVRPVTQPDKTGRARAARLHPGELRKYPEAA